MEPQHWIGIIAVGLTFSGLGLGMYRHLAGRISQVYDDLMGKHEEVQGRISRTREQYVPIRQLDQLEARMSRQIDRIEEGMRERQDQHQKAIMTAISQLTQRLNSMHPCGPAPIGRQEKP